MTEYPRPIRSDRRFGTASVGGTFEGLHLGHRRYLELAISLACEVNVWITGDDLAASYKPYVVSSFSSRSEKVTDFFESAGAKSALILHEIENMEKLAAYAVRSQLDLAIVEPTYFQLFDQYNTQRAMDGLAPFYMLVKPRTSTEFGDVSSTARALPGLA